MKDLSKSLKIAALSDALNFAERIVGKDLSIMNLRPEALDEINYILENLDLLFNVRPEPTRQQRAYQIWASKPKVDGHFMHETCTVRDTYMNQPISEDYSSDVFYRTLSEGGLFDTLSKHKNIMVIDGLFAITYTETTDEEIFQNLRDLHPYCVAHTLHELFKLILEWQWAYEVLDSKEPMASICNDALNYLGIKQSSQSEIVQDLLALPDSFVAQFIKGDELSVKTEDPIQPLSFSIWLVEKGIWLSVQQLMRFTGHLSSSI